MMELEVQMGISIPVFGVLSGALTGGPDGAGGGIGGNLGGFNFGWLCCTNRRKVELF